MKKSVFYIVVTLLFCIIFGIIITLYNRKSNNYWKNQSKISIKDSINLKVVEIEYLRGYLSLNKTFYLVEGNFAKRSMDLREVSELNLPFYIKKAANDDTLWIIRNKDTYYFVFRKDQGSNEY